MSELRPHENEEFDSKTLTMLQNYIKAVINIFHIGPLTAPQVQTVIASLIIQLFNDPYDVSSKIMKTIQAHCQAKESHDKFKDAPVVKCEIQ